MPVPRTGDAGLEGGGSAHEGGGAGLGTGRLGGEHGAGHGVHGDDGHGDDRSLLCFETAAVVAGGGGSGRVSAAIATGECDERGREA